MRVSNLVLIFIFLSAVNAEAKVLIMTVGQVKSHVITSREVAIHNLLEKALGSRFEDFKVDEPVEQVIREWLLFFEASTFYQGKVWSKRIEKDMSQATKKLSKSEQWKNLAVSDSELREVIERRLEADRLYQFKKKASVLPVAGADIETEYTQNRIRYGNLTFEKVKDKIRENKVEENLQSRLEQWFLVLEKKYNVQRFSQVRKIK